MKTYDGLVKQQVTKNNPRKPTWGMCQLTVGAEQLQNPIFAFNQINARHADDTMRGSYKHATTRLVVMKCDNIKGELSLSFLDGTETKDQNQTVLRMNKALPQGTYFIAWDVEWTNLHQVRTGRMHL